MLLILSGTAIPWILGVLFILVLLTFAITIKSWRDMKRSPYFFLRRQAEKRLQTYSLTGLVLVLATAATSAYAWQAPPDTTPRVALLTNAKPPTEEIIALVEASAAAEIAAETAAVESLPITRPTLPLGAPDELPVQAIPVLPEDFDRFEPAAGLNDDTSLGSLSFSTEVSDNYQAINPRRIFAEGTYTLYATFSYAAMADGMEWAWVWRRNGSVVDGGNELWAYGKDGPGYIFYGPEEGFQSGEYSLEVWVNSELFAQSSVIINAAAVSAGN